jgi:hypothetical protein
MVLWNVIPCNLVDMYKYFWEICCLHFQSNFGWDDVYSGRKGLTFQENLLPPSSGPNSIFGFTHLVATISHWPAGSSVSGAPYSSILKMEKTSFSEKLLPSYQSTRRRITEFSNLYIIPICSFTDFTLLREQVLLEMHLTRTLPFTDQLETSTS